MTTSRTSSVYDEIKRDVIAGHLQASKKLRIEELQDRYNAGSTPIREALTRLSGTGLIERFEQRGFRVSEVSAARFETLLWTRTLVECEALRDSIAIGDHAWEERVVLALFHLSRVQLDKADAGLLDRWEASNERFHAELISACRSQPLLTFCEQLYEEGKRYRYIARSMQPIPHSSYDVHKEMADAALARNTGKAIELLANHLRHTGDIIYKRLPSDVPVEEDDSLGATGDKAGKVKKLAPKSGRGAKA